MRLIAFTLCLVACAVPNRSTVTTAEIGLGFGEGHPPLQLWLESSLSERWDSNPAAVVNASSAYASFPFDLRDDVKINAQLWDGREPTDFAAMNNNGAGCVWLANWVTVNDVPVAVTALSWFGSPNPTNGDGCDGWITSAELTRAMSY